MQINPPHPQARVATLMNEALKSKGMSLKKLSELTGITLKNLENLSAGNFDDLPPRPYVRNYIIAIGDILGFDGTTLWEEIKREELVSSSGIDDRLPPNRFARQSLGKKIWLLTGGVVFIIYLASFLPHILGRPSMEITFPPSEIITIHDSPLLVRGRITNGDIVKVNGEMASITNGGWEKEVPLEPRLNTIWISGQKFLGQEIRVVRQVFYEPIVDKGNVKQNEIFPPTSSASSSSEP